MAAALLLLFAAQPSIASSAPDAPQEPDDPVLEAIDPPVAEGFFEREYLTGDWGGLRSALLERGIAIGAGWTAEIARVFDGGIRERSTFHHLLDLNLTFDLETLAGIRGGTLYFDAYSLNGRSLSTDVGDFQSFSSIDNTAIHQIAEAWYEQVLWDGAFRLKVGKVDAATEFMVVDNGGEFVHAGITWSPVVGLPTYPDPATSVNLFVTPCDALTLALGCYDGAGQEGVRTGGRGPKTFLGEPADLYWIAEATLRWSCCDDTLPGRFALGASLHTGTFDRFDGGSERGTKTWYVTGDQTLWRERPDDAADLQGIGACLMLGFADEEVSEADLHLSGGLQWTGALPGRDDDVWGLGFTEVEFSRGAGFTDDRELALELFYKIAVAPWLSVKPDLQYIVNPGGDSSLDNALVGLLRIDIYF